VVGSSRLVGEAGVIKEAPNHPPYLGCGKREVSRAVGRPEINKIGQKVYA
jgi:hypothetical protein